MGQGLNRILLAAILVTATTPLLVAQEHGKQQTAPSTPAAAPAAPAAEAPQAPAHQNEAQKEHGAAEPERRPGGTQGVVGEELAKASNEAAGGEEEEENAKFKHSGAVKWFAHTTGLSEHTAHYVFFFINFGVLVLAIIMIARKAVPPAIHARTRSIRQQIDDATKASQEANSRLSNIEQRLARMDTEVAEMRAAAERDAEAEAQRIRDAAEADKRKVVESAEAEIAAAAKAAQRDLKSYAADLAIALAEKRIRVDAETDRQLVRSFTDQLASGKDGK